MSQFSVSACSSMGSDPRSLSWLHAENDEKRSETKVSPSSERAGRQSSSLSLSLDAPSPSIRSVTRIVPQISLDSSNPQVADKLNTLIVPVLCQMIDQLVINPDLFGITPLKEHPYVEDLKEAFETFNKQFPVDKSQFQKVLEEFSLRYISQMGEIGSSGTVKSRISSVISVALRLIGSSKEDRCIIC